jgi:hypothetical protein
MDRAVTGTASGRWIGRAMTAVPLVILGADGILKLIKTAPMANGLARLGYPDDLVRGIGGVLLLSLTVYIIPRTAMLGAILLTAYLGGAVATEYRARTPPFHLLVAVGLGLMLWGGLYLRDDRVRALLPFRRDRGAL